MKDKPFSLYQIDMKYNRNLANHDDNVLSVSPQVGKEQRPYIGILIMINGKQYCAPITSAKPKHNNLPSKNFDCFKIYDKEKLISIINFNNMIPVCSSVIQKIDIKIYKNDSAKSKINKDLLTKELDWCCKNSETIKKNALKTYNAVTNPKSRNVKLLKRCCDFKKLEAVLDKWIENELSKCDDILKANPELKAKIIKAADKYLKTHKTASSLTAEERFETRMKVLEANPALMSEYKAAEEKLTQKQARIAPKPKHRR